MPEASSSSRLVTAGRLAIALFLPCCQPARAPVTDGRPVWDDPDRHPFAPRPSDRAPTRLWDGLDQIFFRPTSQLFEVRPSGEAINVNAMDEVATSSWFTNRIGLFPMSPEELATGPCTEPPLDVDAPMAVQDSKLDGLTPGFVVRSAGGTKYLLKLDDIDQTPRPTAADAIASRIYYAAGFTTPCNRVVVFERARLVIAPGAQITTWIGTRKPFEPADLELVLTRASRLPDGRYRALASQWLAGKPIGPWRYEETRRDDPNDVVPHEDRREIRGIRLLAAWLDNTDSRAQNTLDVWMPAGAGRGWVRHAIIDFSDCFGAVWSPAERWRRMGHAYWLDPSLIGGDYLMLGVRQHRWETQRFGPSGKTFGYYDVDHFVPDEWRMETPNPAFERMTERDGAWMARILAQLTDAHVERVIQTGRLASRALEEELSRTMRGRRDRLLRRYLSRRSPLAFPMVRSSEKGLALCVRDLAVASSVVARPSYVAMVRASDRATAETLEIGGSAPEVCVAIPRSGGPRLVIDIASGREAPAPGPLRVHLRVSDRTAEVVAIERPE